MAILTLKDSLDKPDTKELMSKQSRHTHMLFYEIVCILAKLGYIKSAKRLEITDDVWPKC